jgi:hypothetical protein
VPWLAQTPVVGMPAPELLLLPLPELEPELPPLDEPEPEPTPLEEPEPELAPDPETTPLDEPDPDPETIPLELPELDEPEPDPDTTPPEEPEPEPEPETTPLDEPASTPESISTSPSESKPGGGAPEHAKPAPIPAARKQMDPAAPVILEFRYGTYFWPPVRLRAETTMWFAGHRFKTNRGQKPAFTAV